MKSDLVIGALQIIGGAALFIREIVFLSKGWYTGAQFLGPFLALSILALSCGIANLIRGYYK